MISNVLYMLYIYSPVGEFRAAMNIDPVLTELSYGLRENEPGVLEMILPFEEAGSYLVAEGLIEVRRSVNGGPFHLEGDTAWFIRRILTSTNSDGDLVVSVTAYSACKLLWRRIVAYFAGTSYTEKISIPWATMMRQVVDENYGPGASYGGDSNRDLEPWFVVAEDTYGGDSHTKSMPWRVVGSTLQDIADAVRASGTYCAFDVVRVAPARFEFRVFLNARGDDHSSDSGSPVIVSEEHRNLASPYLLVDWDEDRNYIYATGRGDEEDRVVEEAFDASRMAIGPFNRCEFQRDARQSELASAVLAEANSALEEFRPRLYFTGTILETEDCVYGLHWKWGDIVTVTYAGVTMDCHVEAVVFRKDTTTGAHLIEGYLRSEQDVT